MFNDPGEEMRAASLAELSRITTEIQALQDQQDRLITQALVAGAKQVDIAEALGIKQSAVSTRIISRGLRP